MPAPRGMPRAARDVCVRAPGLSLLVANEGNFSGGTTGVVTEEDKVLPRTAS